MFSISADFKAAERLLSDIGRKQLPYATALALNDTAADVKEVEERELERDLDHPTPFTKRGFFIRRASKSRLTAQVGVKRIQSGYLIYQAKGGRRMPKRRALLVPVQARRNRYGNLPKAAVPRLKGNAKSFVAGAAHKRTAHLAPGIYQRTGRKGQTKLKLQVAFAPSATYRPRWNFHQAALREARNKFAGHWARRMKQALATAR